MQASGKAFSNGNAIVAYLPDPRVNIACGAEFEQICQFPAFFFDGFSNFIFD